MFLRRLSGFSALTIQCEAVCRIGKANAMQNVMAFGGLCLKNNPPTFLSIKTGVGYQYIANNLAGFIQQLAVGYLARGYLFYVCGEIPAGKDPAKTDRKLLERYGIAQSKHQRYRRKLYGMANVQYLRWGRFFVLMATHGQHSFFKEEEKSIRDFRETPFKVGGYSIGYRRGQGRWHPSVRIELSHYRELKAFFLEIAVHRSGPAIEAEFWGLNLEPYAPVRAQLFSILRLVNRARKAAGFDPVNGVPFRTKRVPVKPFG